MKNPIFSLTLLLLSMCFFSFCKTHTPTTYSKPKLFFGNGGGITGAINEYCLLPTGELFKKNTTDEDFTALPKIKKSKAKALFKQCTDLQVLQSQHNEPGNIYYFITYAADDKTERVAWKPGNAPFNTAQMAFVESLMQLMETPTKNSTDILE